MNGARAGSMIKLENGSALVDKVCHSKVEVKEGNIVALVSTDSVDSDGDIIHQTANDKGKGWDVERFNKHPVMLWAHNQYLPSIGGGKVWVGESELGKGLHFAPVFDSGDEFARQIEGKVQRGVIVETSVGFSSKNYDKRKDNDSPWGGYDFWESELVEISWVNRGANPDVDSMMKSMLLRNPGLLKHMDAEGDPLLEALKVEFTDRLTEIETRLRNLESGIKTRAIEETEDMVDRALESFGRLL